MSSTPALPIYEMKTCLSINLKPTSAETNDQRFHYGNFYVKLASHFSITSLEPEQENIYIGKNRQYNIQMDNFTLLLQNQAMFGLSPEPCLPSVHDANPSSHCASIIPRSCRNSQAPEGLTHNCCLLFPFIVFMLGTIQDTIAPHVVI